MGARWRQRYGKRRTDVNLVSFKRRPINLLLVQLDQGPVFGEIVGLDRDLDLLRVKHEANDALVRVVRRLVTSSWIAFTSSIFFVAFATNATCSLRSR
jgi:hypothetical protein